MLKDQIRNLGKFIFSPAIVFSALVIFFFAAATVLPYALLVLIIYFDGPSRDEVARVVSPDGALDAVLIETNGGATTSFGYEVYIMPRGKKAKGDRVAFLYGARRSSSAYGVNLKWDSPTQLAVEYLNAKDAKLKKTEVSISDKDVKVSLRPGVTDPTAPDLKIKESQ